MKTLVKILVVCVLLFAFSVYITKVTIDQTFKKTECTHYTEISLSHEAPESVEV